MNDKSTQIKNIIAKIDLEKIASYPQLPKSKTLRQIIRYSQRIQESNNDQEIFKLAVDTAYNLDTICDPDKAGYVKDVKEKKHWLEIAKEIFENTVGVKTDKSYIKQDNIKELKTIEEVDYWIDKYLEDYHDDEPHHIKWRLNSLRLLWKRRKELKTMNKT